MENHDELSESATEAENLATPVLPATEVKADYTTGMLCHLLSLTLLIGVPLGNILGPLIIWLIKRDEDPFVDLCGKESLNFQISMTIYIVDRWHLNFFHRRPVHNPRLDDSKHRLYHHSRD